MPTQHLIEGADPTGQPCITSDLLLQMIRAAKPVVGEGFIHWSQAPPDVVTNPEYKDFIWGLIDGGGNKTNQIYYYNGSSWELLPFVIANGSIALTKLSLSGSTPNYIIQVNSLGTALIWTSIIAAIQANTLPANKLLAPDALKNYFLTSLLGATGFTEIKNIVNYIQGSTLPINTLVFGAANRFLRMDPTAANLTWATADLQDILAAGSAAGKSIRRNAGNTAWEYYNPLVAVINDDSTTLNIRIASKVEFNHGLGAVPNFSQWVLLCVSADAGFSVNDELDINGTWIEEGATVGYEPLGTGYANATKVGISITPADDAPFAILTCSNGAEVAITPAKWKLRNRCMLIS